MEAFDPKNAFFVRNGTSSHLFNLDLVDPRRRWSSSRAVKDNGWLQGLWLPDDKKKLNEKLRQKLHGWGNRMRLALISSLWDPLSSPHCLGIDLIYYLTTRYLSTTHLLVSSPDKKHFNSVSGVMVVGVLCPDVAFISSRIPEVNKSGLQKHKKSTCKFCFGTTPETPPHSVTSIDANEYRGASLHHINYFWQGFDGLLDLVFVDSTLSISTSENTIFNFTTDDVRFPSEPLLPERLRYGKPMLSVLFQEFLLQIRFALGKIENDSMHCPGCACDLDRISLGMKNEIDFKPTSLRVFARGDNGFRLIVGDNFNILARFSTTFSTRKYLKI